MSNLTQTMAMLAAIRAHSGMKSSRSFADFFADRIRQACTESSLLAFGERLQNLVECDSGNIPMPTVSEYIAACGSEDARAYWHSCANFPAWRLR